VRDEDVAAGGVGGDPAGSAGIVGDVDGHSAGSGLGRGVDPMGGGWQDQTHAAGVDPGVNVVGGPAERGGDPAPGRSGITIVVVLACFMLGRPIGAAAQYCLIAFTSLAATVLLYDLGVRRTTVTRFLFGLKPARRPNPIKVPAHGRAASMRAPA
jgi:hypothetical protein